MSAFLGIFRNNQAYSEIIQTYLSIFRTLAYSELMHIQNIYSGPEAYLEPCQTPTKDRFTLEAFILYKKFWVPRGLG